MELSSLGAIAAQVAACDTSTLLDPPVCLPAVPLSIQCPANGLHTAARDDSTVCTHAGDLDESPDSWLHLGVALSHLWLLQPSGE